MSFRLHSLARPSLLSTLLTLTMAPSDLFPLYPIIIPLDHTPPHPQPKFITGRFVFILASWSCFILIYAFCVLFCFLLFNSLILCAFFLSINCSPFCHHYYATCLSSFNTLQMFFCRQVYEYFAYILLALILHAHFLFHQQDWSKIPHYEQQVAMQRRSEALESPGGARGSLHPEDPYRTRVNPPNISTKVHRK